MFLKKESKSEDNGGEGEDCGEGKGEGEEGGGRVRGKEFERVVEGGESLGSS